MKDFTSSFKALMDALFTDPRRSLAKMNEWNEANPTIKIRSLANGAYYALDLDTNKAEHYWTIEEAICHALNIKYSRAAEQSIADRPSAKDLSQKASAQIIDINSIRGNRHA